MRKRAIFLSTWLSPQESESCPATWMDLARNSKDHALETTKTSLIKKVAFTKAIARDSYVRLRRTRSRNAPRIRGNVDLQDLINRIEQIRLVNRVTFTFKVEPRL